MDVGVLLGVQLANLFAHAALVQDNNIQSSEGAGIRVL